MHEAIKKTIFELAGKDKPRFEVTLQHIEDEEFLLGQLQNMKKILIEEKTNEIEVMVYNLLLKNMESEPDGEKDNL